MSNETTPWPPHIRKAVRTEYFPASYTLVAKDGDGNRIKYRRTDAKVECDHYAAAVALITRHWTNSPEVLDPLRYRIEGGWMGAGVYVWTVQERQPLEQFGNFVLHLMDAEDEWGADMWDIIAGKAVNLDLAEQPGAAGVLFRRKR